MAESADVRYGRLLEAAEISGYAATRAFDETKQLLESGDWRKVGQFKDISDFIRSIPFGRLNPPESLRKSYEKLANNHGASNRAIANSAGVSPPTVGRDLGPKNVTPETPPSKNGSSKDAAHPRTVTPETPPRVEPPPKPQPVMLSLRTHDGRVVPYPQPQAKATFNATDGEGISWAAWSWNPVTGCLHGCDYCYARAITARWQDAYPAGFTPLFHHERLEAPANTIIPAAHRHDEAWRRVFVCSMADLYGRWVPDEWISAVHDSMLASPQWQYILLTKFPARYPGLQLPPGAWVGTSVDEQKRVRIAENAFREINGVAVKWLSLEPLREPLEFTDLSMFDWVVIGAQTETRQPTGIVAAFAPPFEWVARLVAQAREAGCRVHLKPNLINGRPGMTLPDEYPSAD